MHEAILKRLESAIMDRNPVLALHLQPGLWQTAVEARLAEAGVVGAIEPLLELYSWKNGLSFNRRLKLSETSLFPDSIYQYTDLETAIANYRLIPAVREFFPEKRPSEFYRYFPVFWDWGTSWLAVDVKPSCRNRVMFVESETEWLFRQAYASFDTFIADFLRANVKNKPLRCFGATAL